MSGNIVQIENLQKKYDDFNLDVTLNVPYGTVTGLVGRTVRERVQQ